MKLQIVSDLHISFMYPDRITDVVQKLLGLGKKTKDSILIIAGDIHPLEDVSCYESFFQWISEYYKHIITIPGNHEYYGGDLVQTSLPKRLPDNVTLLSKENPTLTIDHVHFIGLTLWTDIQNFSDNQINAAATNINDFRRIKCDGKRLDPVSWMKEHENNYLALLSAFHELSKKKGKIVCITHHIPDLMLVPEEYKWSTTNAGFACNKLLSRLTMLPHLWIFGHTHSSVDRSVGNTRFICNPYGYHNYQINKKFKPNLIVEL